MRIISTAFFFPKLWTENYADVQIPVRLHLEGTLIPRNQHMSIDVLMQLQLHRTVSKKNYHGKILPLKVDTQAGIDWSSHVPHVL